MEKRTVGCILFILTLGLVCILVAGVDRSSAAPMVLKVSHQFATGDVRDQMARVFGDKVTEMTKGQIQFRYYPAQSLFKANDQWDAMRKGALDMAIFPLDYASGKVPQFSITLMPCTITSVKQGIGWRNKPIGKKIEALMEQNGVKNILWAWFDGGIGTKVRPIRLPEDVKGTKLRAAGKKFELMLKDAGASITSMPSSETYHALATGVIDTMLTSSASFVSYRLYEVLKYLNAPRDYAIWFMTENLCMSMQTWNRLTPEQQKVFTEVADWMSENWILQNFQSLNDDLVKEYTKAGVQIHYMTKPEFDEWLAFAKKTAWKDFAQNVEGGPELLDLAVQAMK
jgi:TRAP-type C4-dicarboxylate transport system substrate-binding protein